MVHIHTVMAVEGDQVFGSPPLGRNRTFFSDTTRSQPKTVFVSGQLNDHVDTHAKAGAAEVVSSVRSIRRAVHWPNTISDTITTHDNQFLLLR
jgi:hypothetical protein